MQTKGFVRRLALTLAGLLTLTVVASGQANASPYHSKLCWPIWSNGQLKIHCQDIPVEWPWEKYLECWMCGVGFEWQHDPVIREDIEGRVGEEIVSGLTLLGNAEFTRDPARRAALEAEAMAAFTTAARLNGKSTMKLDFAGVADPEKNTLRRLDQDWLNAAGTDVGNGIQLLQLSFADPSAAPRLRALAAAEFAEAYDELSQQKVLGG